MPDDVEFHESRAAFDVRQLFEFLVGEVLGALQAVLLERPLLEMWVGLHEGSPELAGQEGLELVAKEAELLAHGHLFGGDAVEGERVPLPAIPA